MEKKASLLLGGPVKIPSEMRLPFRPSCSTAGPGAGSTGIVLAFGGLRVKKAVSRERGDFELVPKDGKYALWHEGSLFIEDVEIKPVVFHAPEQAFFNLDNKCIFGCTFCASSHLDEGFEKGHTPEKIVEQPSPPTWREDWMPWPSPPGCRTIRGRPWKEYPSLLRR